MYGRDTIMESWAQIFAGAGMDVVAESVNCAFIGNSCAVVTCIECLGDEGESRCIATNIFERLDGRWRMVLHHAGPLMR